MRDSISWKFSLASPMNTEPIPIVPVYDKEGSISRSSMSQAHDCTVTAGMAEPVRKGGVEIWSQGTFGSHIHGLVTTAHESDSAHKLMAASLQVNGHFVTRIAKEGKKKTNPTLLDLTPYGHFYQSSNMFPTAFLKGLLREVPGECHRSDSELS